MRSSQKFLDRVFGEDYWYGEEKLREELRFKLDGRIPVLGRVNQENNREGLSIPFHDQQIEFYLANEDGRTVRYENLEGKLSDVLGISDEDVSVIEGTLEMETYKNGDSGWSSWKIWCVPEKIFLSASESSGFSIVADADGNDMLLSEEAYREVFPREIVHTRQTDESELSLGGTRVRFVKLHRSCAEYLTSDDVRVFDHRKKKVDDGITLQTWQVAPRLHVEALRREWQKGHAMDEVSRFAWDALYALANGEVSNDEDQFGTGIKAFTGSEDIQASEIFSPCQPETRTVFRRHHWYGYDRFYFCQNPLNPSYVIIRDDNSGDFENT
jgi:hypothetical protein